jgi:hypothetical protein
MAATGLQSHQTGLRGSRPVRMPLDQSAIHHVSRAQSILVGPFTSLQTGLQMDH